jgi:hypothetical protein
MATEQFKINMIKGMSKEERIEMNRQFICDPDLYNAAHGIGGLSQNANRGLLQGTTYAGTEILKGIPVIISTGGKILKTVSSNQYGYYQSELAAGTYLVKFVSGSKESEETEVVIANGKTITLDYDSEAVPEPPIPPAGGGGE